MDIYFSALVSKFLEFKALSGRKIVCDSVSSEGGRSCADQYLFCGSIREKITVCGV